MLTAHERAVLRDLAGQIEVQDPALARALSDHVWRRVTRLVGRALAVAGAVAIGPLLAMGVLVGGLDAHVQVLTVLGSIAICAALPLSGWLAHHVHRRLAPRGPRPA
jgi:hypothetical protein